MNKHQNAIYEFYPQELVESDDYLEFFNKIVI